jgi:hypothetical protein
MGAIAEVRGETTCEPFDLCKTQALQEARGSQSRLHVYRRRACRADRAAVDATPLGESPMTATKEENGSFVGIAIRGFLKSLLPSGRPRRSRAVVLANLVLIQ